MLNNFLVTRLKQIYTKFYKSRIDQNKLVIISPFQFILRRGVERFTYSLANQLVDDYELHIVIYTWKSTDIIEWGEWHKNIRIRRIPFSKYFQKFWAQIFYRVWIMIDRPDKILINFLYHGENSLPKNVEYYYVLHSPASQVPHRYRFIKNNIDQYKKINFIAVSKFVMKKAEPFINDYMINVIYNGVDTEYFTLKDVQDNDETLELITLSALEERKGIQFIIIALSQIKDLSIHYNIYGNGPYKENLKDLIKVNNLEKTVFIHHSTGNVKDLLHRSDVYCLPSKGEAFPLGPLEAMSCGLPIIVSNHPPYDEFVNKKVGFKVSTDSIESVIYAINALKDKNIRREMGRFGRELVENVFNWELVASKYHKCLYHNGNNNRLTKK